MHERDWDATGGVTRSIFMSRARPVVTATLVVFEEAHTPANVSEPGKTDIPSTQMSVSGQTPTSDEREAIIDALLDELGWEWDEVPEEHILSSREILGDMADRVLTVLAGFNRTAHAKDLATSAEPVRNQPDSFHVPPTDNERKVLEEILDDKLQSLTDTRAICYPLADAVLAAGFHRTVQGEPTNDGHLITDCEHGVNSLYDRCAPCEAAEQAEPSDAQVEAALAGWRNEWNSDDMEAMRAALKAAAAVQGGETR